MKNQITFAIEVCCVIVFLTLFFLKALFGLIPSWLIVSSPLFLLGLIRMFVVFLVAIYNITNLFKWLRWKITGKMPKVKSQAKQRGRRTYAKG